MPLSRLHRRAVVASMAALVVAPIAAIAAGGLTLSPLVTEKVAAKGTLGTVVVRNTSDAAVTVTVTPRRWHQSRSGKVTSNGQKSLLAWVRPSARTFRLDAGKSRSVALELLNVPPSGSLFGAVSVRSKPVKTRKKKGGQVIATYELVGAFRATPKNPRRSLKVGGLTAKGRKVLLAVRSKGNTIDPVSGRFRLKGPTGTTTGDFASVRIMPGSLVDLPVGSVGKGSFRLTGTLLQGGVSTPINRTIKVR